MVAGEERHDERAKGGGNTLRHTFVKERKEDEERENAQKNQVEIVTGLKADASPIRLIIVLARES